MLYLIDGYNLLHCMGVMQKRMGPTGLEKARLRLLGMLRGALGDDAAHVTVVFDAAHAPPGAVDVQDYHGIEVRFAVEHDQADDLIELLIRRASAPRQLTVVSDDHRLQRAARRRHCVSLGCGDFQDWLDRRRQQNHPQVPREPIGKPEGLSREETQHWLREFGGLENDPDFKEVFDPFDFDEK